MWRKQLAERSFQVDDTLMVVLPIVIAAINLVVAYWMRRSSNARRRAWSLPARLVGLFVLTSAVWLVAAFPYIAGFADSYPSFDSYARTIQGTTPSPLDNNYIQYQR